MNLLKKLFKTEKPHAEFAPDEELVEVIRTVMGDSVANQVRGRLDQREEYDADVAALEEELTDLAHRLQRTIERDNALYEQACNTNTRLLDLLCVVGGALPQNVCGVFCANGYPFQGECPYEDAKPIGKGLSSCANFYADSEWKKVLTDRRAFLLRKRDNNQLTDEEKDELLRSLDKEVSV